MKQKQIKINPKGKTPFKQTKKEVVKKIIGHKGETNDSEEENVTVGAVMQTKRPAKKVVGKAINQKKEESGPISEDKNMKVAPVTKKMTGKVVKKEIKKNERVEASDSDATEDKEDEDNVSEDDSVVIETTNRLESEDDDSNDVMEEYKVEEESEPQGARCHVDKTINIRNSAISIKKEEEEEEPSELRKNISHIIVEGIQTYTNQNDLKEHFANCGKIGSIKLIKSENISCAHIFFRSPFSASRALKLDKSILNGQTITIKPEKSKYVFNPKNSISIINCRKLTTLDIATLERIFAKCGSIDEIHVLCMPNILAFITFENEEGIENALRLNGKTEEGLQLKIELCKKRTINKRSSNDIEQNATRSISIINREHLESVDPAKLEAIFSKCGTIDKMRVVCGKNILAFITFIDEESVDNALELNSKTVEGLKLQIEKYKKLELHRPDPALKPKKSYSVLVQHLNSDVTVPDLYKLFSQCGEVSGVQLKTGEAIVNFKTADAFCKSFLLHDTMLKNREIYLQPYTEKKVFLKNKELRHGKRPFTSHFPSSNGAPKRIKSEK
uniref:RRM domain-containing protein n=1 Tax=Glossina palpalis gambiensis TaxID=67801 RepID=A0A1B0AV73_9MUSC